MTLGYRFQPIDVTIEGHPKAFAAGVEAMGLWLWGMVHARQQKTRGHISRPAALGAWSGKRNIMLAKRLVEAGLWLAREDGSWDIFNFDSKSAGESTSSTERMRRHRAKRDGVVTSQVASRDVTSDASQVTLCSPSLSPSLSLSSLASPDGVVIDDALRGWAGMAGAPEPTPDHLAEFQLDARKHGKVFADPAAAFKSWLLKQKRFDSDRRARGSPNGRHVQSAENRSWIPPKDMP